MKTNYLKKLEQITQSFTKSFGVALVATALAAAACGTQQYLQSRRELATGERVEIATDKMEEILKLNGLFQQIDTGRSEDAKAALGAAIASDVRTLEPLLAFTDPGTVEVAQTLCNLVAHDQTDRPSYGIALSHHGWTGGREK